jgi:flagellar biosynthesis regulator FlaF
MFPEPDDYVREMQSRCDTEVKRVNALLSAERARAERAERERDEALENGKRLVAIIEDVTHERDRLRVELKEAVLEVLRAALREGWLRARARGWKRAAKRFREYYLASHDVRGDLRARLDKWAEAERRWIDEPVYTESGRTTRFCKWAMVPEGEE